MRVGSYLNLSHVLALAYVGFAAHACVAGSGDELGSGGDGVSYSTGNLDFQCDQTRFSCEADLSSLRTCPNGRGELSAMLVVAFESANTLNYNDAVRWKSSVASSNAELATYISKASAKGGTYTLLSANKKTLVSQGPMASATGGTVIAVNANATFEISDPQAFLRKLVFAANDLANQKGTTKFAHITASGSATLTCAPQDITAPPQPGDQPPSDTNPSDPANPTDPVTRADDAPRCKTTDAYGVGDPNFHTKIRLASDPNTVLYKLANDEHVVIDLSKNINRNPTLPGLANVTCESQYGWWPLIYNGQAAYACSGGKASTSSPSQPWLACTSPL